MRRRSKVIWVIRVVSMRVCGSCIVVLSRRVVSMLRLISLSVSRLDWL